MASKFNHREILIIPASKRLLFNKMIGYNFFFVGINATGRLNQAPTHYIANCAMTPKLRKLISKFLPKETKRDYTNSKKELILRNNNLRIRK